MRTLSRSILVLACLLSLLLIGLSGCEQAEEAKKAAGELMTETVDKAQDTIKEVTGTAEESEGKGDEEGAESVEDEGEEEGEEEDAEPTEDKDNDDR